MPAEPLPPVWVTDALRAGLVIPAHPLALTADRRFDETRQRGLTEYYLECGVGGLAVAVHSTQFEIREPRFGLLRPVLELAAETIATWERVHDRRVVRIAGICGETAQAVAEAEQARELGYHAGLLSLGALRGEGEAAMLAHARTVAETLPLIGFYLQPAAGGVLLSQAFWREFCEIANVLAIKVAPFNRYQTLDVVRAVAESGRAAEIPLYTGNDDNIVADLLTEFEVRLPSGPVRVPFVGGLLGHWACWTRSAVEIQRRCREARLAGVVPAELLTLAAAVTDCNAAFFDAAHGYAGCLAGISEVLRRQGLLDNCLCLDPGERLSPGQAEEIERVWRAYPELAEPLAEG